MFSAMLQIALLDNHNVDDIY